MGQYVMPNPGTREIENDSGGLAGRITKIIRANGKAEDTAATKTEEKALDTMEDIVKGSHEEATGLSGDGKDVVFVTWDVDGLEKGELIAAAAADSAAAAVVTAPVIKFYLFAIAHHIALLYQPSDADDSSSHIHARGIRTSKPVGARHGGEKSWK